MFSFRLLVLMMLMVVSLRQPALATTFDYNGLASIPLQDTSCGIVRRMTQGQIDRPETVVIAIHGMSLYGGSYDALNAQLAEAGIKMIAPDFRGYGNWYQKQDKDCRFSGDTTLADLKKLIDKTRRSNPGARIVLLGESLGAALAIVAASQSKVDGLILSAPALNVKFAPKLIAKVFPYVIRPDSPIDLTSVIRERLTDNPDEKQYLLDNQLVRKTTSIRELLSIRSTIQQARADLKKLNSDLPVLALQGDRDAIISLNSLEVVNKNFHGYDKTVKVIPRAPHLLVEVRSPDKTAVEAIENWLLTPRSQALADARRF